MSNNYTSIEAELLEKGKLLYTNIGDSMLPLIREGKDIILIVRPEIWNRIDAADPLEQDYSPVKKLKRLDVVLFKDCRGKYILHRVLKVRKSDYLICGDNRYRTEFGITDSQVLGILDSVFRNGREISVHSLKYRVYSHLWCDLFPLRTVILMGKNFLSRHLKKSILE